MILPGLPFGILKPAGEIIYVGGRAQSFAGSMSVISASLTGLTGGTDTSPKSGDLVVAFYGVSSTVTTRNISIGASDGWSNLTKIEADDTFDANFVAAHKFMGTTPDSSVNLSATGSTSDPGAFAVHVFRGVRRSNPFDVAPTSATGINSALPDPPSILPVTKGAWVVSCGLSAHGGGENTLTSSDLTNFRTAGRNTATNDVLIGAGANAWISGSFNPAKFGWTGLDGSAASWAAYTIALRPS